MPMNNWPESLLKNVPWRFWEEKPYNAQNDFEEAVTRWQKIVDEESETADWRPNELALRASLVEVRYFGVSAADDEEYSEFTAELSSEKETFTRAELLFKLHNAVVEHLNAVDHCYFEGLE